MMNINNSRLRRATKTRAKMALLNKTRLTVFRSNTNIYAQIIDGSENKVIASTIDKLKSLYDVLIKTDTKVSFDFSDIRGYQYHSGLIFSAYSPNYSTAIAQGGRYDNISNRSNRAATGFSMDLRFIINQMKV